MEHLDLGSIEQWILIILALFSQSFGLLRWVSNGFDNVYKHIDSVKKERDKQIEFVKERAELRYAEGAKRDAELSERITSTRADYMQALTQYVTRPELDRRLEKIEDALTITDSKLDAILHRLAGVKII